MVSKNIGKLRHKLKILPELTWSNDKKNLDLKDELMNEIITEVFVEQHLALPGSSNKGEVKKVHPVDRN